MVGARRARVPLRASFKEKHYPETRFGGFTDVDGTIAFYTRVQSLLTESSIVLDVGGGRGAYADDEVAVRRNLRILRGKVARVIGLDVDPVAHSNPFQDEFRLLTGPRWPVEDDSIDLCLCDSVLEHIEQPVVLDPPVQHVVGRLVDKERRTHRPKNRSGALRLRACVRRDACIEGFALPNR